MQNACRWRKDVHLAGTGARAERARRTVRHDRLPRYGRHPDRHRHAIARQLSDDPLEAETGGLSLDSTVNGPVQLTVTPPSGVPVPVSFPTSATLVNGQASITAKFSTAGYYRIEAQGPHGSVGWVTVDVGVTPNTAP